MNDRIGFVGGGNMAGSLIGGLIKAGRQPGDLVVIEPDARRRQQLAADFAVIATDISATIDDCDTVILAVKPQVMSSACAIIDARPDTLYISIAAGIRTAEINRWLGADKALAIVRCMPNTPALLQCGASGLYANERVDAEQHERAQEILEAVGIVAWVGSESDIDAVTAVSGSGPAYFFLMMEAMQAAGEQLGLEGEVARRLVLQTALGAARMAIESDAPPAELRARVTSKGGTTQQAIESFQHDGFEQMVNRALHAARDRAITLADEMAREAAREPATTDHRNDDE